MTTTVMKKRVIRPVTKARSYRRRLVGTAVGALVAAAVICLTTATGTTPAPAAGAYTAPAPIADEAPGYAVEDFTYPGADKILADQGITLKRGDGHIVLAACSSDEGFIRVLARSKPEICFRATGTSGYLSMEIPSVYGVKGGDESAQVDLTVDDETETYDVDPGTWTAVGESADPEAREWMLMEIRTGS